MCNSSQIHELDSDGFYSRRTEHLGDLIFGPIFGGGQDAGLQTGGFKPFCPDPAGFEGQIAVIPPNGMSLGVEFGIDIGGIDPGSGELHGNFAAVAGNFGFGEIHTCFDRSLNGDEGVVLCGGFHQSFNGLADNGHALRPRRRFPVAFDRDHSLIPVFHQVQIPQKPHLFEDQRCGP